MKNKVIVGLLVAVSVLAAGCGNQAVQEASSEVSNAEEQTETVIEEAEAPKSDSALSSTEYVYGTATLSYADFYSGDVSSTDSYDAVSSATFKKYEIFSNMDTDYVDETTNAEGYHILGVKNVNVAVPADQVDAYAQINETFVKADTAPVQYKVVTVENGAATYSETTLNVAETVTDATCELKTGSNWGDYQLNITETSTAFIRNTKEDEGFAISADVQGIILETKSGLKVGMEHLQSIWVKPGEIAFNIEADNSHNSRVSFDNLAELSKLEKEEIVSVTFINQNDAYVYTFDPVYVKPVYRDTNVTGKVDEEAANMAFSNVPEGLEAPAVTVTYVVGQGKEAVKTVLYEGELADEIAFDQDAFKEAKKNQAEEGRYVTVISSDNYANVPVTVE